IKGAEFPLHGEEGARVAHRGVDLQAVAHDGTVAPQRSATPSIETCYAPHIEVSEGAAVARALMQDRRPREPCLGALEREHLEEAPVIVPRPPPFLVVIAHVVWIGGLSPPTAPAVRGLPALRAQCSGFIDHGPIMTRALGGIVQSARRQAPPPR